MRACARSVGAPQVQVCYQVVYTYDPRKKGRIPVRGYLEKQGRFAHLVDEDFVYIQGMVDKMWNEWEIPGVAPFRGELRA